MERHTSCKGLATCLPEGSWGACGHAPCWRTGHSKLQQNCGWPSHELCLQPACQTLVTAVPAVGRYHLSVYCIKGLRRVQGKCLPAARRAAARRGRRMLVPRAAVAQASGSAVNCRVAAPPSAIFLLQSEFSHYRPCRFVPVAKLSRALNLMPPPVTLALLCASKVQHPRPHVPPCTEVWGAHTKHPNEGPLTVWPPK